MCGPIWQMTFYSSEIGSGEALYTALTLLTFNCVKINKDMHILSATKMWTRDSCFSHYKVCADICGDSLERRCQMVFCPATRACTLA